LVLDVRFKLGGPPGRIDYDRGHIPGAVFCDLDTVLAAPPGEGGRHPLPDIDVFGAAMRALGVRADHPVVTYDGTDMSAAARAWWCLRYFGHPAVSVLNGGYEAWQASGGASSVEAPEVQPADFVPRPGGMPLLDAASAAALASSGVLIDVRAPERFRGNVEPIDPVAGHIPGARNLPYASNLTDQGLMRPAAELSHGFAEVGAREGSQIGTYCGSGVVASGQVLALEVAGLPGAALYAGSWSDWITDPDRPIAVGA